MTVVIVFSFFVSCAADTKQASKHILFSEDAMKTLKHRRASQ